MMGVIVMILMIMIMVIVIIFVGIMLVDVGRIRGVVMTMAVVMELGGDPGHGEAQDECTAQENSIMAVKLQFRQKITECDAEEHAHREAQRGRHPHRSEFTGSDPHHHTDQHPQRGDESEEDIDDDTGSNGSTGRGHDGDEAQ